MRSILGIDLGIKTGLAHFLENGKLISYWSHNFGTRNKLRKGVYTILTNIARERQIKCIVIEGSKIFAKPWTNMAKRLNVDCHIVEPHIWREQLFGKKDITSQDAKKKATVYARKIIINSGLSPPKYLNHNAAEAILIGFWGVINFGNNEEEVLGEKLFYR